MPERDERRESEEALLAFLANGTLEPDEREALSRRIGADPDFAREAAYVTRLRDGVKAATPAPDPGELPLRRALRTIRAEQRAAFRVSPRWRAAAVAAGVLLALQTGWLVAQRLAVPGGPALLGSETPAGDAVVLQVAFAPEASEAAIRALLAELGARFVDGPSASGVYRVSLSGVDPKAAASDEAAERAIARLRARPDVVRHVARE